MPVRTAASLVTGRAPARGRPHSLSVACRNLELFDLRIASALYQLVVSVGSGFIFELVRWLSTAFALIDLATASAVGE